MLRVGGGLVTPRCRRVRYRRVTRITRSPTSASTLYSTPMTLLSRCVRIDSLSRFTAPARAQTEKDDWRIRPWPRITASRIKGRVSRPCRRSRKGPVCIRRSPERDFGHSHAGVIGFNAGAPTHESCSTHRNVARWHDQPGPQEGVIAGITTQDSAGKRGVGVALGRRIRTRESVRRCASSEPTRPTATSNVGCRTCSGTGNHPHAGKCGSVLMNYEPPSSRIRACRS